MKNIKIISILSLILLSLHLHAGCGRYLRGELVCELTDAKDKVSMQLVKMGCEFPEGNRTNCIYAISCIDDKIFVGANRYQKISNSDSFCLTAKEDQGLLKKAFYSKKEGKRAFNVSLNCSKYKEKKENEVILSIGSLKKVCKLDASLKKMETKEEEPLVGLK